MNCDQCSNFKQCSVVRRSNPEVSERMWSIGFWGKAEQMCIRFNEVKEYVSKK